MRIVLAHGFPGFGILQVGEVTIAYFRDIAAMLRERGFEVFTPDVDPLGTVDNALLYGKTAFTLAKDIGVTKKEAEQFIEAKFARYLRSGSSSKGRSRRRGRRDTAAPSSAGCAACPSCAPRTSRSGWRRSARS